MAAQPTHPLRNKTLIAGLIKGNQLVVIIYLTFLHLRKLTAGTQGHEGA